MRAMLVLASVLASSNALAGSEHFTLYGAGTAFANDDQGMMLRVEKHFDMKRSADRDDERSIMGGRLGLEFWNAGGYTGIAMPVGFYLGAQVSKVRTSLGGGVGLWAFEFRGGNEPAGGVAPFVSSTLELMHMDGKVIALEGRLSRQVLGEHDDFNVYSVMLSFGPHYAR